MEDIPQQSPERQPSEEDLEALKRAIARVGVIAARETLEPVAMDRTTEGRTRETTPTEGITPDFNQDRSSSFADLNGRDESDNFDTSQKPERDFEMSMQLFDQREQILEDIASKSGSVREIEQNADMQFVTIVGLAKKYDISIHKAALMYAERISHSG